MGRLLKNNSKQALKKQLKIFENYKS